MKARHVILPLLGAIIGAFFFFWNDHPKIWVYVLRVPNDEVHSWAVTSLEEMGPKSLPEVLKALKSENDQVRLGALQVLYTFGSEGRTALPILIELLKDQNAEVRRRSIAVLGVISPDASITVPALTETLQDKYTRDTSIITLGEIGPLAKASVPKLTQFLKDPDWATRNFTAQALGKMGAGGKEAIPTLFETLGDEQWRVKLSAAVALAKIDFKKFGKNDSLPLIGKILNGQMVEADEQYDSRLDGISALGEIGPNAKEMLPFVVNALRDQDDRTRIWASISLAKIDSEHSGKNEAIVTLINVLDSEFWKSNQKIYCDSAEALGMFGPSAKVAIPSLERMLRQDRHSRSVAQQAIKKITQ